MIEVRVEGMKPVAVTDEAETTEQAMNGALDKLKASLQTIFGKLKQY